MASGHKVKMLAPGPRLEVVELDGFQIYATAVHVHAYPSHTSLTIELTPQCMEIILNDANVRLRIKHPEYGTIDFDSIEVFEKAIKPKESLSDERAIEFEDDAL